MVPPGPEESGPHVLLRRGAPLDDPFRPKEWLDGRTKAYTRRKLWRSFNALKKLQLDEEEKCVYDCAICMPGS